LTFRSCDVTFQPQFTPSKCCAQGRCLHFPLVTPLSSRQNHKFASSHEYSQIYYSRSKLQKLSYCHILQNKNRSCICSEMLYPVYYFSKHSIQSYAALPVAVANASVSKPQLLYICRWCWLFTELTWNLSIRSKATSAKSFLMLLAYRKQIIQNQHKTVRRAVTINVYWRESSCELFPLATSHAKVANSGKMVIARYRMRYFFQKRAALSLLQN